MKRIRCAGDTSENANWTTIPQQKTLPPGKQVRLDRRSIDKKKGVTKEGRRRKLETSRRPGRTAGYLLTSSLLLWRGKN